MAKAKTKNELIYQANYGFSKLCETINAMPTHALQTEFDFSNDAGKKEQHWSRDRNLRDVLIHLYEWHQLLLRWVDSNSSGNKVHFLPGPYSWKTYGEMNIEFCNKHQETDLEEAKRLLNESHNAALELAKSFTNEELFTKQYFSWTGTTSLGSYCISAMPSHYEWAIKKLRAHVKKVS